MVIDHERKNVPTHRDGTSHTMVAMSMYVDILSSALGIWDDDLSDSALVEYALSCRAEVLRVGSRQRDTAYSSLAIEVAYDRALVKLCETYDVPVMATNFFYPRAERARLERQLALSGLDLADLAARRRDA
jgi:hypothetical protein